MLLPSTKGSVSVVDRTGVSFTRIWCVFELWSSLVNPDLVGKEGGYTYDMYTAERHVFLPDVYRPLMRDAVGLTDGLAQNDSGLITRSTLTSYKTHREANFPLSVLDKAIVFKCEDGDASMPRDKVRIMAEIDRRGQASALNNTVHGFVAASSLRRAITSGDGAHLERYLAAIRMGQVKKLQLHCGTRSGWHWRTRFTQSVIARVVDALDPEYLEELSLTNMPLAVNTLPDSLGRLTKMRSLTLSGSKGLVKLPETTKNLTKLVTVDLYGCSGLSSLPDFSTAKTYRHQPRKFAGVREGLVAAWVERGLIYTESITPAAVEEGKFFKAMPGVINMCILASDGFGRTLCGEANEPMTAPFRQRLNRVTCDGSACRMRHAMYLKGQLLALGGVYLGVSYLCLLFGLWCFLMVANANCDVTTTNGQEAATCTHPWVFWMLFAICVLAACACACLGIQRRSTNNRSEERAAEVGPTMAEVQHAAAAPPPTSTPPSAPAPQEIMVEDIDHDDAKAKP